MARSGNGESGGQPSISLQKKREIRDRIRQCYKKIVGVLTYDGFARHLGVPRTTITGWFGNPPRVPSSAHVLALAERANVSPTWLLLGEGPELRGMPLPATDLAPALEQALQSHLLAKGAGIESISQFIAEGNELGYSLVEMFLLFWDVQYQDWLKKTLARLEREQLVKDKKVIDDLFGLLHQADQAVREADEAGHPLNGISVPAVPIRDAAWAIARVLRAGPPQASPSIAKKRSSHPRLPS